jgi:hypothetical protein
MKGFFLKILHACFLLCLFYNTSAQVRTVRIILAKDAGTVMHNTRKILERQLTQRANVTIVNDSSAGLTIALIMKAGTAPGSFSISDKGKNYVEITGTDEPAVLYGAGKLLRTSLYNQGGFTPGTWRGSSAPKGAIRGMYLATHFSNFYEAAPIEDVQKYVEELALWGINHLVIHFATWQYTSFYDADAQKALTRFRQIMGIAKACGMKVGLLQVPNQGFKFTKTELLNTPVPDPLGRRGHFGTNLNPSNMQADKLLKEDWAYLLDQFKDIGLDIMAFWPYDEGGCGCDQCWPWGARGYPKLCRELSEITSEKFPGINIILSTWMYDTPPAGEWEGLTQFLNNGNNWVHYIMADAHEDFPTYPLQSGVPGNLPLLNFPEISMWKQSPWGGYGSNPLANRLQRLWNQTNHKVSGGFPYSEGIYEDLNKIICAQLYWDGIRNTSDIVKEYIGYEYSPDVIKELSEVIDILEANHNREQIKASAIKAFNLVKQAQLKLTPQTQKCWRWRILYLRALIDSELYKRKGKLEGEVLRNAFNELTEIYYAQHAHSMPIHPPVVK